MEYKKIDEKHYLIRLDVKDEVVDCLRRFAVNEHIKLAQIQGLGATDDCTVGVFNTETKKYKSNHLTGAFEIVSLIGTIDTMNGKFYSHYHIGLGDEEGHMWGGHLNEAHISVTAEIIATLIDGEIDRHLSPQIGINIWQF